MSIIGHKGIQVLSDINSVDDLPEVADVESEAVWYIESGDLAPDYIAPSFWDGQQFNEWISLVDGEVLGAIPDIVVRQNDDDSTGASNEIGTRYESDKKFDFISAIISANASGYSTAYFRDLDDDELLDSVDISDKDPGDRVDFDVKVEESTLYFLGMDNDGDSMTHGYLDDSNYSLPIENETEDARMLGGDIRDSGTDDRLFNWSEIGPTARFD